MEFQFEKVILSITLVISIGCSVSWTVVIMIKSKREKEQNIENKIDKFCSCFWIMTREKRRITMSGVQLMIQSAAHKI